MVQLNEKIYNVDEVAEYLNVDKRLIYREVQQGNIKAKKLGKRIIISETALKNFLEL